jgi:hypothetical protein
MGLDSVRVELLAAAFFELGQLANRQGAAPGQRRAVYPRGLA